MNNKGFAITGILYTLFVLFTMILLSILASLSYKREILEKTIVKLEETYQLEEDNLATSSYTTSTNNITTANFKGKYIFELKYIIDSTEYIQNCTAYLKKGDIIPNINEPSLGTNNPAINFKLVPEICNNYSYTIDLTGTPELNKLVLKEVYKYKGSD